MGQKGEDGLGDKEQGRIQEKKEAEAMVIPRDKGTHRKGPTGHGGSRNAVDLTGRLAQSGHQERGGREELDI